MLAYAVHRPVPGKRQSSPNALLLVISVHVAAIAVLMSAKMDLPQRILRQSPIIVDFIKDPPPSPISAPKPPPKPRQTNTFIDRTQPTVASPTNNDATVDLGPASVDPGPVAGAGANVTATIPRPLASFVRHDPRLLTPPSQLKPPYPASKLLSEEEATLNLRLSIDEEGRVVAVDPIGRADREFLDAARRHLMARWRYAPATEDGRAVASSIMVALRFRLDG